MVRPKDIVWHLGDFCFSKRNLEIAARLNGNKKLVMGNHDMFERWSLNVHGICTQRRFPIRVTSAFPLSR